MKTFQSDKGTEFVNQHVSTLLTKNDMHNRLSCAHTLQQNGWAERKHRHIIETGLVMLFNANAPASLWVDAFSLATNIINRLPSKILDYKSPFELLYHSTPNYNVFKEFGCRVFPYLRNYSTNKLAPRSISCVFIGYSSQYKGYRCLDPSSNRIYTTCHAVFDEQNFPFSDITSKSDQATLVFSKFEDLASLSHPHQTSDALSTSSTSATVSPCSLCHAPEISITVPPIQPSSSVDIDQSLSTNAVEQPLPTADAAAQPSPPASQSLVSPLHLHSQVHQLSPLHQFIL